MLLLTANESKHRAWVSRSIKTSWPTEFIYCSSFFRASRLSAVVPCRASAIIANFRFPDATCQLMCPPPSPLEPRRSGTCDRLSPIETTPIYRKFRDSWPRDRSLPGAAPISIETRRVAAHDLFTCVSIKLELMREE